MGKKLPYTPNAQIRSALRTLWMRSRERSTALKNTGNCCSICGLKQSRAKGREVYLDVHHLDNVDWDGLFDEIRRRLLHPPERLTPLCNGKGIGNDCHKKYHKTLDHQPTPPEEEDPF